MPADHRTFVVPDGGVNPPTHSKFKWEVKQYRVYGVPPMSDEWWEREKRNATIMPSPEEFKKILEGVKKK